MGNKNLLTLDHKAKIQAVTSNILISRARNEDDFKALNTKPLEPRCPPIVSSWPKSATEQLTKKLTHPASGYIKC